MSMQVNLVKDCVLRYDIIQYDMMRYDMIW